MQEFTSAIYASIAQVLVFQPFDILRTKLSLAKPGISTKQLFRTIYKQQGIKGFYKGLGLSLLTSPISLSIYMGLNKKITQTISKSIWIQNKLTVNVLSSLLTGLVSNVITHPLWLIRIRTQATYENKCCKLLQNVITIYRSQGITGFYKGLGSSQIGLLHVGIYFPLYEYIKERLNIHQFKQNFSNSNIFVASSIAKFISIIATYPNVVFSNKIQCSSLNQKNTFLGIVKQTYKEFGIKGFFAGMRMDVIKSVPSNAFTFMLYEYIKKINTKLYL